MKLFRFENLASFAKACRNLPESALTQKRRGKAHWSGEPYDVTLERCANGGTDELVPQAEALIAQIQASLPETDTPRWALDVAGAFPCVPAFLSGEPESMWNKHEIADERAPLRVYASMCCSCSVDAEDMRRRGAGILAFVLLASRTRAVELYLYSDWCEYDDGVGDTVLLLKLPTHPMMLSETAWALTSPALMRNIGFDYLAYNVPTIPSSFPWGAATVADRRRGGPAQRRLLGLEPQDVLIGPVYMGDPLTCDPVGFVNRELAKLGITEVQPC